MCVSVPVGFLLQPRTNPSKVVFYLRDAVREVLVI